MGSDFPLFPEAASTVARQVDGIYLFLVAISAFFTLLIAASVIYCAVRYRRRSPDEVGGVFHANMLLEITWTIIPLGIVLFVFFWGARVFFVQFKPPAHALELTGIAKQWMWYFQHPEGQREINTLHVPLGQPIQLTLISQDVIHSAFIPAFRVKTDVLPGRYTTLWFEATEAGSYHLFCAEYCGAEHSRMTGQVIVLEPEDYERWLAGGATTKPPVEAGADLFAELACHTCHTGGADARGPELRDLFGHQVALADGRTVVADETYLRESILDSTAKVVAGYMPIMPSYREQISEENVFKLVTYIKSLSTGIPARPTAEPATGEAADDAAAAPAAGGAATNPEAPATGGGETSQ